MSRLVALALLVYGIVFCLGCWAGDQKRPFTVQDSIAWTKILPMNGDSAVDGAGEVALFSPDRSHFIVRTRRGDLTRNVNVDTVLMYETSAVRRYGRSSLKLAVPSPSILASIPFSNDWEGISSVQWLDDSKLGFISGGKDGHRQAYALDVRTREVSQLTFSETDVVSFGYSGDTLLYYARAPQPSRRGQVVVVDRPLTELLAANADPDWIDLLPIEAHVGFRGGKSGRLSLPAMRLLPQFRRIWVSPDGERAIVLSPAVDAPAHWRDYRMIDFDQLGFAAGRVRSDPTSMDLLWHVRYQVLDLKSGDVRPLLDAPLGVLSQNETPVEVFWRKDSESVIVTNTYLPLKLVEDGTLSRRSRQPAVAELDLGTGKIGVVTWEDVPVEGTSGKGASQQTRILGFDWYPDANMLAVVRRRSSDGSLMRETLQKRDGAWVAAKSSAGEPDPDVEIRQTMAQRPRLYVAATRGSRSAIERGMLFDPNPQADALALGVVEVFEWTDANKIAWKGGLVLPPAFSSQERYPLVIQTHGFDREQFLLDGPSTLGSSAFAAQVLASAGFVVLQVEDNPATFTRDAREGGMAAEGLRSAIESLDRKAMIDPARVGVIGFSRTGYHVISLLARHPNLVAAAALSDALQPGYVDYLLTTVNSPETELQLSQLTGGPPDVTRIGDWFARNPLYALGNANTAIRLEENGGFAGLGLWETYSVLRAAQRPVDFILFPEGSHVLQKPAERLASQGGTVDWFRFWLQGYEDPDAAKIDQYKRWRPLRSLQGKSHGADSR